MKGLTISIIGLISSGKSTLVDNLINSHQDYIPFREPVEENPYLTLYYQDPHRWAYTMQTYLLWERYKQAQEAFYRACKGEVAILDSTLSSDFAFALVQKRDHFFTDAEFKTYCDMHEIVTATSAYPDLTIWLEVSPETAMERLKKRSRECESGVPLEYLQKLYEAYQIVLERIKGHTEVVKIDARPSAREVFETVQDLIEERRRCLL